MSVLDSLRGQKEATPKSGATKAIKTKVLGQYFTPHSLFEEFIWPEVKNVLWDYLWVDLFAGKGDLILPILDRLPEKDRESFFRRHIYLQEVDQETVLTLRDRLIKKYGFPKDLVDERVALRDTLREYPEWLSNQPYPVYHITNPPYLYLGHIRKRKEYAIHLDLFSGGKRGLQDLYQIALYNDVVNNVVARAIYIIPTNFIFGDSASNKIRDLVFSIWEINRGVILERGSFEETGTHIGIFFFSRKPHPDSCPQSFHVVKIGPRGGEKRKVYTLLPENHYRAGTGFWDFVKKHRSPEPLSFHFYLYWDEVKCNEGLREVILMDANSHQKGGGYKVFKANVNDLLWQKLKSNPVYVRTVDTGRIEGRAGLYLLGDLAVDGIVVTKAPYRTHPIQVFFHENLTEEQLKLIVEYFNLVLEYFRKTEEGEFLTTYKYSPSSNYTRKYIGLKAVSAIIKTFPRRALVDVSFRAELERKIKARDAGGVLSMVKEANRAFVLKASESQLTTKKGKSPRLKSEEKRAALTPLFEED